MSCHQLNLIIIFMWELLYSSGIELGKTCLLDKLFECSEEETCEQLRGSISEGTCKCRKKYQRSNSTGNCEPLPTVETTDSSHPALPAPEGVYSHGSSASAIAAGLLVPLLLIAVAATLILAAKKYRWLHRVREHAHQLRARHYDTVLVNQEDDPPLA